MSLPLITHAKTLAELLIERLTHGGDRLALHGPCAAKSECLTRSWDELRADVLAMMGVLRAQGVAPGDRVAQLSENRYEWILVDFACLLARAVHVPLHASLAGHQAMEQILHAEARLVFVSTREQAAKLAEQRYRWPVDIGFITHTSCAGVLGDQWRGETAQLMHEHLSPGQDEAQDFEEPARSIDESTLASILYTSGTTGEPKGVMLTHGNLASNAIAATTAFGEQPNEVKVGFLPLSHIFARTCDLYSWLVRGGELVIASSRENVLAECVRFQPTVINGVPYFYERIYRTLCEQKLLDTPGIVQRMLGGRIRFCNSGGAALPTHVFDFFHAQHVPLLEGYGLSETSPVITLSTENAFKRGSCGQTIEGVELSIAEDGEILTRGPHVMHGYYKAPEATNEVLVSGWFRTGDLGRLDDDGFLFITGRKKELIVLSSGKNIAPVYLEGLLTSHPAISQAMIVGEGRSYLAALIVPSAAGVDPSDEATIARFQKIIDTALEHCSHHEQVRRFALLTEPFSIERGELTPKLSLRRQEVAAHYAEHIKTLYAGDQQPCD
jgi:long-chain acyl-CoA synthetase